MSNLLNKLTSYRNWIGKSILVLIGIVLAIAIHYAPIVKFFLITEKDIPFTNTQYIIYFSMSLLLIVNGAFLNKFLDVMLSVLSKIGSAFLTKKNNQL